MTPATSLCSQCFAAHGRWLPASSAVATVDYFRCGYCHHVWCLPKQTQAASAPAAVEAATSANLS
jgi:hypothetical protein